MGFRKIRSTIFLSLGIKDIAGEIKSKIDAERISEIILRSLRDDKITLNPFQSSIFQFNVGIP